MSTSATHEARIIQPALRSSVSMAMLLWLSSPHAARTQDQGKGESGLDRGNIDTLGQRQVHRNHELPPRSPAAVNGSPWHREQSLLPLNDRRMRPQYRSSAMITTI
jgi:hypothetical protein